jgi:Cell wall synthesis protein CwsA
MSERNWMAVLTTVLREEAPRSTMTSAEVDTLIADVVSGRIQPPEQSGLRRRRQRRWIAGGIAFGLLAGGATAAAVWNSRRPDHPQEGVACHASARIDDTLTVVIGQNADPIAACAQLWISGAIPGGATGATARSAPSMFACVGPGGGLEVFPRISGSATTCPDLGLADATLDAQEEPFAELRQRLVDDINLRCVNLETARRLVTTAFADLALTDWTITTGDDPEGCVKAVEDVQTRSVHLFAFPT